MLAKRKLLASLFSLALILGLSVSVRAQDEAEEDRAPDNRAAINATQRLANADPLIRQQAAEELARLSAAGQQKLVEGYYMQEKNSRVKLALAWALYRMGKSETLFAVVRDLDSSRAVQASGYLRRLDAPDPLYMFLTGAKPRMQVELLKVLADIGDQTTLAQIEALTNSLDEKVSAAAKSSTRTINERLARNPSPLPERPRQVGKADETSP